MHICFTYFLTYPNNPVFFRSQLQFISNLTIISFGHLAFRDWNPITSVLILFTINSNSLHILDKLNPIQVQFRMESDNGWTRQGNLGGDLIVKYSPVRNYNCHPSLQCHYCVLSPISSSRAEYRHVSWHTYRPYGRLRLAYSSYSRNPNVVSGLRCARSTTREIQLNSDDRDYGAKPLM